MQRRNIVNIGDKFGQLTVIDIAKEKKYNSITFVCKCDCGNIKNIVKNELVYGSTVSCGCYSKELTKIGDVFGLLKVIEEDKSVTTGRRKWICECECGNKKTLPGNALQSGNTKSCGCINSREYKNKKYFNTKHGLVTITGRYKETTFYIYVCECGKTGKVTETGIKSIQHCGCLDPKPELIIEPESIKNLTPGVFNRIKRSADYRNIPFNVTQKEIWDLYIKQNKQCALSGESICISPQRIKNTASLDRVDSSQGYEINNLQWVHRELNIIKGKWNQSTFLSWVEKISNFQKNKDNKNAA